MMSDNTHFPSLPPSDDAAAVVSIQSVIDYFIAHYCGAMKREIRRNGLEEAMKLWEKVIGIHHTEDWWPPVARAVEAVINEAFEARARKEEIARQQELDLQRQQVPVIDVAVNQNISQTQANREEKIDKRSVNMSGDHATYEENNQPNE